MEWVKLGNQIQCTDWPWNALPTDDESPQTKHVNSYMMLLEPEDPTQPIFGMGEAKHSEFATSSDHGKYYPTDDKSPKRHVVQSFSDRWASCVTQMAWWMQIKDMIQQWSQGSEIQKCKEKVTVIFLDILTAEGFSLKQTGKSIHTVCE